MICANDLMAIGAIAAARHECGLSPPDDLSIVGFDGVGPAAWPSYRLTTIRQPVRRMTDAAVTMLLERMEDPSLPHEIRSFAGTLIEGGSAKIRPTGVDCEISGRHSTFVEHGDTIIGSIRGGDAERRGRRGGPCAARPRPDHAGFGHAVTHVGRGAEPLSVIDPWFAADWTARS